MNPPLDWNELLAASSHVAYVAELDGERVWAADPAWGGWRVFETDAPALSAAREGEQLDIAYRVSGPEGLRWIHDRATRREVDGRPRWVGLWRDASAEHARAREGAAVQRLDAWAQLGSALAHEVNNPLAGVLNYAELARRMAQPDPRYDEALEAIVSEGGRIRSLTEGVRALPRRATTGDYPIDPGHLAQGVIAPLRRTLREQMITLELEAPAGLLPARGVGYAVQGALVELLDNAVAACAGGERASLRLEVENDEVDDALVVVFTVRDTGPGIDDPSQARARFFTTRPGAAGLGLNLAADWAGSLGGSLRLARGPEGGTVATLVVPTV